MFFRLVFTGFGLNSRSRFFIMKILFLGYSDCDILKFLENNEEIVTVWQEPISKELLKYYDFAISYGYRHIIKEDCLGIIPIINLHIAYLPYNRGADPNYWSFVDNTPSGVTIHNIDKGIDTGDILVQKKVKLSRRETLRSSYAKLQAEIQSLFIMNWDDIKSGRIKPKKQKDKGTYHKMSDNKYKVSGWLDIPIYKLLCGTQ